MSGKEPVVDVDNIRRPHNKTSGCDELERKQGAVSKVFCSILRNSLVATPFCMRGQVAYTNQMNARLSSIRLNTGWLVINCVQKAKTDKEETVR